MKRSSARLVAAFVGGLVLSTAAAAAQQPPPMPAPGPEHQILKMDEGTWDAVVEFVPGPGMPAVTSKGVEVNTMGCGGLCLITDFKGDAMGSAFHGHGTATWDAQKKKYVGSWIDSMSRGLALSQGTWDPATRTFTGTMEGPDMKTRTVVEYRNGSRVMTAFAAGPDGKEMQVLKITYTKRK